MRYKKIQKKTQKLKRIKKKDKEYGFQSFKIDNYTEFISYNRNDINNNT